MTKPGETLTHATGIGPEISYRLVPNPRRRNLTLEVDESGLTVHVPRGTRQRAVELLLEQHRLWILRKLAEYQDAGAQGGRRMLADGSVVHLQGQALRLTYTGASAAFPLGEVRIAGDRLELSVFPELASGDPDAHVRLPLAGWYMQRARRVLPRLAEQYARRLGLGAPPVHIRDQKRRWGSCSERGEIRLNYRIIIPPPEVTQYIVAHEVCHLLQLNHSPSFWATVARLKPDYQRLRRLLRHWEPRMHL